MDDYDGVMIDGQHADGRCPECDAPTLNGEGDSCCGYADACRTCGGATCDQSC